LDTHRFAFSIAVIASNIVNLVPILDPFIFVNKAVGQHINFIVSKFNT
jgi:hypothetical protein